jgi:AcrR family transcriptional regulator
MIAKADSASPGPPPGSAVWWRDRLRSGPSAGRPRVNGLSLDRIYDATVEIIENEGLEAVTMRRVADNLGTGPASLYRHVAGRDELLVLLTDRLLDAEVGTTEDVGAAEAPVGWRAGCELIARRFRDLLTREPVLAALAPRGQMLGPNSLKGRERILAWLVDEGFSASLAARTYLLLTRYVIGSLHTYGRSSKTHADERAELVGLFRELDPSEFPTVVALAEELGGQRPEDEFEFGLTALLDGIAASRAREMKSRRSKK